MRSSYRPEDVTILLKDITGLIDPLPATVREERIQHGVHYCEMLPLEYKPSEKYMATYQAAIEHYAGATAAAVGILAEKIYRKKNGTPVIVSLARAGIPIGILLRRYLKNRYGVGIQHYAISIIRGRGIDRNAVDHILKHHETKDVQLIDGWIGKGAILSQVKEALKDYPQIDAELGVISDPACLTDLCGTHEDILIPSSCLNATVTGLLSRTFLRADIIGPDDFHGAACYRELEGEDLSEAFLQAIESKFQYDLPVETAEKPQAVCGMDVVRRISEEYGVADVNLIKPGIGEATRVLLRRLPWKVIVNEKYADADELKHIRQLAKEKDIACENSRVEMGNYKVCGIIKDLSDV